MSVSVRCRNQAERDAHARWARRRRRMIGYGTWQPFVDAQPIREHVLAIRDAGMPPRDLAIKLGLPQDAFRHMLWGATGHDPGQMIRRETAELVLSFWPSLADFPDGARIDPTGTRRRVDALMTLGWTRKAMAQEMGMRHTTLNRALAGERITARIARGVSALYDQWWDQKPEDHGVPGVYAERTRHMSAAKGLLSPLAWDDGAIDDPQAQPLVDADVPKPDGDAENAAARWLAGESVVLGPAARREVIAHLMEWTDQTPEQIANRLEMNPDAVSRSWERTKERARAEGRPVPWRRVYLSLRELGLDDNEKTTKNEMGSAA